MSTPSIKVGQGNWGIKAGNLLGYANTEKKFSPVEFTSTRALNTATRVNESGNIEIVNANIPRIDYFGGQASLLVEPSAQNLALQSSDYLVSSTWALSNLNSTSGITSPSGTNDALLLEATTTSPRLRQNITLTSGTTYTFSWFGKFGSISSGFAMNVFDENSTTYGSGVCQAFNLNEGTLGASGTVGAGFTLQSAGMENYGNGWYRCRMTVLMGYTPATPRVGMRLGTQISGGRPLGVLSGTVNLWGAQLETGSVATSYIPTTTSTVTRNNDNISLTGVSGLIGQTEGTIYCEFVNTIVASYAEGYVYRVFADANNEIWARKEGGTNTYSFRWRANSQNTTFLNVAVPNGVNKIAFGYKSGDTALFLNGSQVSTTNTDVRAFSVNPTTIALGSTSSGQFFNDRIRAVSIYQTRLPNTTTDGSPSLQSITIL